MKPGSYLLCSRMSTERSLNCSAFTYPFIDSDVAHVLMEAGEVFCTREEVLISRPVSGVRSLSSQWLCLGLIGPASRIRVFTSARMRVSGPCVLEWDVYAPDNLIVHPLCDYPVFPPT